jgi:drug/metabolite transporter (DMT)-like permease
MSAGALVLVLTAAVLHVGWNALAKRGRNQICFLWSAQSAAGALFAPAAAWVVAMEGFPAAAAPFVIATGALHALYFYALGRSYRSGAFSLVYPVARGLGVALVPALASVVFQERPSPLGALGMGLVVVGIVVLQLATHGWSRLAAQLGQAGPGTAWAALTGLTIACYSLVDKAGVARLHPLPYVTLMGFGAGLLMLPAVRGGGDALQREWATNWRSILAASTMTLTSYLMILFAFRLSKVSYVVAAREISIVLSAMIGSVWFKEGPLGPRLAGAAVVAAGVVCVGLAK